MPKIAALLMVTGIGCRMADPKGIWTNGVWITATATATLAVLTAYHYNVFLKKAVIAGAAIMMFCIVFGLIRLAKEIIRWVDE